MDKLLVFSHLNFVNPNSDLLHSVVVSWTSTQSRCLLALQPPQLLGERQSQAAVDLPDLQGVTTLLELLVQISRHHSPTERQEKTQLTCVCVCVSYSWMLICHLSLCVSSCSVRRVAAAGLMTSLSEEMFLFSSSQSATEAPDCS